MVSEKYEEISRIFGHYSETYLEPYLEPTMIEQFYKNSDRLLAVIYPHKTLHPRCFTEF